MDLFESFPYTGYNIILGVYPLKVNRHTFLHHKTTFNIIHQAIIKYKSRSSIGHYHRLNDARMSKDDVNMHETSFSRKRFWWQWNLQDFLVRSRDPAEQGAEAAKNGNKKKTQTKQICSDVNRIAFFSHSKNRVYTFPETNTCTWKWMIGILCSFRDGQFSGAYDQITWKVGTIIIDPFTDLTSVDYVVTHMQKNVDFHLQPGECLG